MMNPVGNKVCIVIPCRNEEDFIEACLDSVVRNNYPEDLLDILVCDGMSTDNTRSLVHSWAERYPSIKLLDNPSQTTPQALNIGIKSSLSDTYIILSAHAQIAGDYLVACLDALKNASAEVGCVGGFMEAVYSDKEAAAIGQAMSSSFGVGNSYFRTGQKEGYVDTVVFGAYRKEIFEKIGYFDESLIRNQDDEFNFRLVKNGYKILLSSKIRSSYQVRSSLGKLFRQFYQYGFWKVVVNSRHKTITTFRQLVPAIFVFFVAGGLILSFINNTAAIIFVSGLLFYLTLSLLVAIRISTRKTSPLMIMVSFWILHTSYGLGYWEAVFKILLLGQSPRGRQQLTR